LDENLLMIQFNNRDEKGIRYQVFDLDGQLLLESPGMIRPFVYARDGLAYHVVMPEQEDVDEAASNPRIEVYRYVGPRKAEN